MPIRQQERQLLCFFKHKSVTKVNILNHTSALLWNVQVYLLLDNTVHTCDNFTSYGTGDIDADEKTTLAALCILLPKKGVKDAMLYISEVFKVSCL